MPTSASKPAKPALVAKAALLFGSGTLTSRILGLIRDALLFALMPKDMRDAWVAAWRVPNLFRRLFGEGGLSVSFIPLYVETLKKGNSEDEHLLVNGLFSLLMSVVALICMICFFFMEPLIHIWLSGPGFSEVPGKLAMTVQMAKIMVFFLFFIVLFAFYMAILNGRKKFALTGYAPMFLNVAIISSLSFFKDSDQLAWAAAWGVVIGGAIQAFVLLPQVIQLKALPKLTAQVYNPMVKKVVFRFMPTMLAVGTLQILNMINVYFASQLPPGTVGYFYMADRLLELPFSLVAVSIGTALLPTLSGYWANNDKELFLGSISKHLSLFFFLALPAAFGLWFMGIDIVEVLFKRGEFTSEDVPYVSGILQVYCLTLMCAGSLKITNQAFYATGDTYTPALVSLFGLVIHLFLAPELMNLFGVQGLALSTALITLFSFVVGSTLLQKRVGWFYWGDISKHFIKVFAAASVMGVYLYSLQQYPWKSGHFVYDFAVLLLLIGSAGLLYFLASTLLKVEEMQILRKRFLKKGS